MQFIRRYYIKKLISELLNQDSLVLLDIGAAGGVEPRWKGLEKYLSYIGVEPDPRSAENLNSSGVSNKFKSFKILPFALWSSAGKKRLNLCKQLSASSLYEPNLKLINKFPKAERFTVEKVTEVSTSTISDCNLQPLDFIKLDKQGAELEILIGAENNISTLIGLEVEVQFVEIYKHQPLFHEISARMEGKGFIL